MKVPSFFVWFKSTEWKFFFSSSSSCTIHTHVYIFACCVVYFCLTSAVCRVCIYPPTWISRAVHTSYIFRLSVDIFIHINLYFVSFHLLENQKRMCEWIYYFVACMHTNDINYGIYTTSFMSSISSIMAFCVCLYVCEKERMLIRVKFNEWFLLWNSWSYNSSKVNRNDVIYFDTFVQQHNYNSSSNISSQIQHQREKKRHWHKTRYFLLRRKRK